MQKEHIGEIHLPNGEKLSVIGENERFWICEHSQFFKARWSLHKIVAEQKPEEQEKSNKKQEKKGGKKK